jgi:type IV secretory pathway VirB4 component
MLNVNKGHPVAIIDGGNNSGKIIYIDETMDRGYESIGLEDGKMRMLMDYFSRKVYFIAGPAGSGKTTFAANLIKDYLKMYPDCEFYFISRTIGNDDPALKGLKINQIRLDDSLINNPINIEKEIGKRSIFFFDDCNTITDEKLKSYVEKLMYDIMEVGRKLNINIIITQHLLNSSEKKLGRAIMNELNFMTFFPRSGSAHSINYCLKTYFGLTKKHIDHILNLPSRSVTISKNYPMYILYDKGIYIL